MGRLTRSGHPPSTRPPRYLASHWSAPTVLVGEAPGKNGARRTGLPFTSMRQMTGEGPAEPTATIVQRVLGELGQEDQVLLWNASMLFAAGQPDPRREEIDACSPMLDLVCRGRKVLAVGRHAELATGAPYIRHPSHGGVPSSPTGSVLPCFADGLRAALSSPPSRGPWSDGARFGDVASRQPVGTLDVTMHSSPEPRRRDSPLAPRAGANPLVAEYKILVDPPHRSGGRPGGIAVVAVVAVGVGALRPRPPRWVGGPPGPSGPPQPRLADRWPAQALAVVSSVPVTGASNVPSDQVVTVHFSKPIGRQRPARLRPPGQRVVDQGGIVSLSFDAHAHPSFRPLTESLVIPAGAAGPAQPSGRTLAQPGHAHLHRGSVEHRTPAAIAGAARLPPADLYSQRPVELTPTRRSRPSRAVRLALAVAARLTDRSVDRGTENVITKAAVMNFENQNGLGVDGLAGKEVWTALLADLASGKVNASSYNYAFVSKQLPENLTVYVNGSPQLANIPGQHRGTGSRHHRRHLSGVRACHQLADGGDQSGRQPLRRSQRALGQLLQRGGCAPWVRAGLLRLPPEQRMCRDGHRQRRPGVAAHPDRHFGDGGRTRVLTGGATGRYSSGTAGAPARASVTGGRNHSVTTMVGVVPMTRR